MKISVVIPSYNVVSGRGEETLQAVLDAATAQELPAEEIILADSSDDGTDQFVAAHYPRVTVLHFEERMYAGEARNAGAGAARGGILAFIDSDCVPSRLWLAAVAAAYRESGVVAVTGPVRGPDGENVFARIDRIMHLNHLAHLETAHHTRHASTSNLSVRAEVFRELGGFPTGLAANEDYAFCKALIARHGPIMVARHAAVQHVSQGTDQGLLHHQRRFGHGFVDGRRADPTLRGAFAVRHPWLVPVLPVMRGTAIIARLARYNRRDLCALMAHPILFARALGAWSSGIRDGVAGGGIEWDVREPDSRWEPAEAAIQDEPPTGS